MSACPTIGVLGCFCLVWLTDPHSKRACASALTGDLLCAQARESAAARAAAERAMSGSASQPDPAASAGSAAPAAHPNQPAVSHTLSGSHVQTQQHVQGKPPAPPQQAPANHRQQPPPPPAGPPSRPAGQQAPVQLQSETPASAAEQQVHHPLPQSSQQLHSQLPQQPARHQKQPQQAPGQHRQHAQPQQQQPRQQAQQGGSQQVPLHPPGMAGSAAGRSSSDGRVREVPRSELPRQGSSGAPSKPGPISTRRDLSQSGGDGSPKGTKSRDKDAARGQRGKAVAGAPGPRSSASASLPAQEKPVEHANPFDGLPDEDTSPPAAPAVKAEPVGGKKASKRPHRSTDPTRAPADETVPQQPAAGKPAAERNSSGTEQGMQSGSAGEISAKQGIEAEHARAAKPASANGIQEQPHKVPVEESEPVLAHEPGNSFGGGSGRGFRPGRGRGRGRRGRGGRDGTVGSAPGSET